MLRRISITLLVLFAYLLLSILPLSAEYAIDPEEYFVYSTIINELYGGSKVELLIIRDRTMLEEVLTSLEEDLLYILGRFPELSKDTVSDFKVKNLYSYPLSRFFNQPLNYKLITDVELDHIFEGKGWPELQRKYPDSNGILSFSRVGFDPEKTQSLVYVKNQEDGLVGEGFYFFLEKQDYGTWIIRDKERIWGSWDADNY